MTRIIALVPFEKKYFTLLLQNCWQNPFTCLNIGKRGISLFTTGRTMTPFSVKSDNKMLLVITCYLLQNFQDRMEAGSIDMKPFNCCKIFILEVYKALIISLIGFCRNRQMAVFTKTPRWIYHKIWCYSNRCKIWSYFKKLWHSKITSLGSFEWPEFPWCALTIHSIAFGIYNN